MQTSESIQGITNRALYADTKFETMPHIELGRPIDHLSEELQQSVRACANDGVHISWTGDGRHGMLGRISAAAAEDSAINEEPETLNEGQAVVLWTAGYDDNDEPIDTVHLVTDDEAKTIHYNATSALLAQLLAYYDRAEHSSEVKPNGPLDRLLRMLRTRKARATTQS